MVLPYLEAAGIGLLGAAIAYYLPWHKGEPLLKKGRALIFDIVVFLAIAACISALLHPDTELQALFIGFGWPGLIGSLVSKANAQYSREIKQDVQP